MILDTNMWGDFLKPKNQDMKPIQNWLEKRNGKLVYSRHQGFIKELSEKHLQLLQEYGRTGKAKLVDKKEVTKAIEEIKNEHNIENSDDHHILGLAKASRVNLLCTKDKILHKYFKEIIKGNIYQDKSHQRLLTSSLCAQRQ